MALWAVIGVLALSVLLNVAQNRTLGKAVDLIAEQRAALARAEKTLRSWERPVAIRAWDCDHNRGIPFRVPPYRD